jgi:hypothetical protein
MRIEFASRSFASRRKTGTRIWFKAVMHFSSYWMILALAVVGVEVVYALYQLANLVL